MSAASEVLPLIPKIYDCILETGGLPEIGETLVRLAGGHMGAIVSHRSDRSTFFAEMAYGVDVSARDAYLSHYDKINPLHSLERQSRPGEIVTASHLITSDQYTGSEFYNEFARKRDHWDYVGVMLSKDASTMTGFSIMRPHRAGLITPMQIERLRLIGPHLQRAYLIKERLNEAMTQANALEAAIEGAGFGVIITTATGQIVYANCTAENLLRARRGLQSERGRINATDSKTAQQLQALISAASRPTHDAAPGGSLLIADEDGTASLALHIVPISIDSSKLLLYKQQPFAGVFVVDRRCKTNDRVRKFAALFRLTPGETRVLGEVIAGEGIARVSERLHITELTARAHLKHIVAKTDTHRQAELVKLFFETTLPGEGYVAQRPVLGWRGSKALDLIRS